MRDEFDLPQGLELALYWAGRGCRVHPVHYIPATDTHKAQKKPIFKTWQKQATADTELIRRWWGKWPDMWVGMATGAPGYDVVDFDVADNAPGKLSFERLIEAGLIDGYLLDADTPSGGWHRFFPGTGQRNSQIEAAGVDFRSTGGFVMAPGNPGYVITAIPAGQDLAEPVDWAACKALLAPPRSLGPGSSAQPPAISLNQPALAAPGIPAQRAGSRPNGLVSPRPDESWTWQQAQAEINRWQGQLAAARIGSINHTLNNAAMRIGRFVPAFIDWAQAVLKLTSALSLTEYDGQTWKADDTIRSGLTAGMRQPYERRPDDTPAATTAPSAASQSVVAGAVAPPAIADPLSNQRRLGVQKASEFTIQRVRWLWADRIPAGEITLIAGREGSGKSTFLTWLARAMTRGELPGEYLGRPRAVLYAAAEDSWEHTLAPRLAAAGADLDLVYRVGVVTEDLHRDGDFRKPGKSRNPAIEGQLVLPMDVAAIAQLGVELDAAVLMLDPGLSFLDSRVDSFKSQELRPALEALRRGAEQAGMSVAMLCHFNKTQGTDVLSKVAGSRAFAEVARAALAVAVDDSEDEEGNPVDHVILSQVKNNLGRSNLPNLTYRIVDTAVPTADGDAHVGRLIWVGETDRSAEQALNGVMAKERREKQPEKYDPVKDWVIERGRTVSVAEVHEAFPMLNRDAVKKRLQRLVGHGLYRPITGHYAADHTVPPVPDVPGAQEDSAESNACDTESGGTTGGVPLSSPSRRPSVPDTGIPQFQSIVPRERERTEGTTGHDDKAPARESRTRLRSPQSADDESGWLVHGDPYTRGV